MATLLVYVGIVLSGVLSIAMPWVGILSTYLVTLLTPQNIWFWAFDGLQPVQYVIVPTIVGVVLAAMRKKIDFSSVTNPLWGMLALLLATYAVSFIMGPYSRVIAATRIYDAFSVFDVLWKAFFACFLASLLLTTRERLYAGLLVLSATCAYMTYWINDQYVFGGRFGRIGGPTPPGGGSIYADENIFAVLFVVGFPILFYIGRYLWGSTSLRGKMIALGCFAIVPLMWHAAFLTASRGAIVAIGCVLAVAAVRSGNRLISLLLAVAFGVAFLYQGGDMLHERASSIREYDDDTSATERLEAWGVAIEMALAYPFTGVGLGSFTVAFPEFADSRPRIAHNTPLQIAAESGLLALALYCAIAVSLFRGLIRLEKSLRSTTESTTDARRLRFACEGLLLALVGFFASAMFLSLDRFELFFFLVALTNAAIHVGEKSAPRSAETGDVLRRHRPLGTRRG